MIRTPRAAAVLVAAASAIASGQFTGFAPRVDLPMPGYNPVGSVLADLDNDGDLDIAACGFSAAGLDHFAIFLNNGDATFTGPTYWSVGNSPTAIIAKDVNLDGKMDLLTSNRDTDDFSLRLGDGDGTFGPELYWSVGDRPQDLVSADFNGDGLPDVAVVNEFDDSVSVFFGNGAGGFALNFTYTTNNPDGNYGNGPRGITAADLNFDGLPDIVTANTSSNRATVMYNIAGAPGNFFYGEFAYFLTTGETPFDVDAHDHDNDGDVDLVFANGGGTVTRRFNEYNESGGVAFPSFPTSSNYNLGASSRLVELCTADFDDLESDADRDIVVSDEVNSRIGLLMNNGSGGISFGGWYATGSAPEHPSSGDLDGDGDIDLVVAQYSAGSVGVFVNKSTVALADPPVVRIDSPGSYGTTGGCVCGPNATITGVAYSPDAYFDHYSVRVRPVSNPAGWVTLAFSGTAVGEPGGTLATWDATGLGEGFYLFSLTGVNLAGNSTTAETVVWLSQNYSSLNVGIPAIVGSTACVTGFANDDGCGPNGYTVDYRPSAGGVWIPVDPAHPTYSGDALNVTLATWDTIGLAIPDGNYQIRVVAYNGCGQQKSSTLSVKVDNTAPTVAITVPDQCSIFAPFGAVEVRGTAIDANLGSWSLQFTGGPFTSWQTIGTGFANVNNGLLANWDISGLPPCAYTLRLVASDTATLNCNGAIDHTSVYLRSVQLGCRADLAEPYNLLDLADVLAFVEAFTAGCP